MFAEDGWILEDGVWTRRLQDRVDSCAEVTDDVIADLDAALNEIVRLQERVRSLERVQSMPDNSFWGQLIFDVGIVVAIVLMLVLWR